MNNRGKNESENENSFLDDDDLLHTPSEYKPPPILKSDRKKFVLDTSLFVNPDTQKKLGVNLKSAVQNFIDIARRNDIELYMPTSIYKELSHFVTRETLKTIRENFTIRGPNIYNIKIPAAILHLFIQDLRRRLDKGLRIAEEAIRTEHTEKNIQRVRNQYRTALRSGIIDSVEDLDVILLAMELQGAVLSADEGITKMADALGIEVFSAGDFILKFGRKTDS